MKRKVFLLTMIVVMGLLLVACGGAEEPSQDVVVGEEVAAQPVEESAAVEEAEEVAEAEEPAEAEAVEEVDLAVTSEELDAAFQYFLDGMEAYNTIGIDALNEMMVEQPPFLLDVRAASELEENGWIEGAVNVPLREIGENMDVMPAFGETIVSYCGSGWRCTIALTALEAMGWEDVLGLKGGSYGGWVDAGYSYEEGEVPEPELLNAAEPDLTLADHFDEVLASVPEGYGVITGDDLNTAIAENPDLILIDVRRPQEVEENGYIDAPNVEFIPLEDFVAMRDQWPADLDSPIVTYCGSGHRSTIAMAILWSYGYSDIHSLKGGYSGWVEAGFPTIGAPEEIDATGEADLDAAFNAFLAGMEGYNTIGLEDLNLLLLEDPPPFLLDVREPGELEENGHIESAVNIPLREVADHIELLPSSDTTIVSYCGSGWRCTIAIAALEAMGWENALALKGGSFGGWVTEGYQVIDGAAAEPLVLDIAAPDPALVAALQEMLQNVPDGFGVITADNLATALVENPDVVVIDVRRTEELEEQGVIEADNWIHIPLEEFVNSQDLWPEDLDAPIVVYCGSGHRSTLAMAILWTYGYTDVHSLKGGFGGWVEAGYPVVELEAVSS